MVICALSVVEMAHGIYRADSLARGQQRRQFLDELNAQIPIHPVTDGLGLGLSIYKEFVEAHRGRISLAQNPGGGTLAKFVLPIQASPAV